MFACLSSRAGTRAQEDRQTNTAALARQTRANSARVILAWHRFPNVCHQSGVLVCYSPRRKIDKTPYELSEGSLGCGLRQFARPVAHHCRDRLFQLAVLQVPIPNFGEIALGILFVVIGLTLFVQGLNMGLFPIGETMTYSFASKGNIFWLLLFAFALGFGTTIAEPALIAVANEAAIAAAEGGMIEKLEEEKASYALGLRITVAISVGLGV